MALAARIRPVGSVNVAVMSKHKGLDERRILAEQASGQALIEASGHQHIQLGEYHHHIHHARDIADMEMVYKLEQQFLPHIAQYVGATESLRFIPVTDVQAERMKIGGTAADRIMVTTTLGEMLLPDATRVVWL